MCMQRIQKQRSTEINMKKKLIYLLCMAVLLCPILTGCKSSEGSEESESAVTLEDGVYEIEFEAGGYCYSM